MMRKHALGFTLLELVVAGTIVAILATIAVPTYSAYVLRANRAVARGALTDMAAKEELRTLRTGNYDTDSVRKLVGLASDQSFYYIDRNGKITADSASGSLYKISLSAGTSDTICTVSAPTAPSFVLLAAPVSGSAQAGDTKCGTLCLSSAGLRGATGGSGPTECWGR